MTNGVKVGIAVLCMLLGLSACDKDRSFPATPSMEFRELIQLSADSIMLVNYFQDGDGDIGSRLEFPAEGEDPCPQRDVLYRYYELEDGVWNHITAFDGGYCILSLTPIGQDKTLEGEVQLRFLLPIDLGDASPNSDSTRIGMLLQDRAGNLSNEVYSPLLLRD